MKCKKFRNEGSRIKLWGVALELDRANTLTLESESPYNKQHSAYISYMYHRQTPTIIFQSQIYCDKKTHRTCCSVRLDPFFVPTGMGEKWRQMPLEKSKGVVRPRYCKVPSFYDSENRGTARSFPAFVWPTCQWLGNQCWSPIINVAFVWDASVMFSEWIQNF